MRTISLKHHGGKIHAGEHSPTRLNLLVGFNNRESRGDELAKVDALSSKVDMVADLSTVRVGIEDTVWYHVATETNCVAATVPIYLAADDCSNVHSETLLGCIEEQCENGVGLITIHPTPSRELLDLSSRRIIRCTSRGGSIVIRDMLKNGRESNIYLENLDEIVTIARRYDVVLSIGTSFRSGTIVDSFDDTQMLEIREQKRIADYISNNGVDVIIESPGHLHPERIDTATKILGRLGYPLMPLGPVLSDVAEMYDDVCGAIGATVLGLRGCADILSIITSEEHSGNIPSMNSMREAVNKYRLAAHIIDLAKTGDDSQDRFISDIRAMGESCIAEPGKVCDRCGHFCPLRNLSPEN